MIRLKRSKTENGKRLPAMELQIRTHCRTNDKRIKVIFPSSLSYYDDTLFTKKEARRLASALLKLSKEL